MEKLGNKAHDTSASENHTLLVACQDLLGDFILVKITHHKLDNHSNVLSFIGNCLMTHSTHGTALHNGQPQETQELQGRWEAKIVGAAAQTER